MRRPIYHRCPTFWLVDEKRGHTRTNSSPQAKNDGKWRYIFNAIDCDCYIIHYLIFKLPLLLVNGQFTALLCFFLPKFGNWWCPARFGWPLWAKIRVGPQKSGCYKTDSESKTVGHPRGEFSRMFLDFPWISSSSHGLSDPLPLKPPAFQVQAILWMGYPGPQPGRFDPDWAALIP